MANTRTGNQGSGTDNSLEYEMASVDTDPGALGYGCIGVRLADYPHVDQMNFVILTIGTSAEITLQYSEDNTTFYDYQDSPYTAITNKIIYDKNFYWRGLVKDDKQGSSGTSLFGIRWGAEE